MRITFSALLILALLQFIQTKPCQQFYPGVFPYDQNLYLSLITNVNGNPPGHALSSHLAVNGKCTDTQKKQGKTVFLNLDQMSKAFRLDDTTCVDDLRNMNDFAQIQKTIKISTPVKGIDCRSEAPGTFKEFLILYRKAIVKPAGGNIPSDAFSKTQILTVYTMYPTTLAMTPKRLQKN